MGMLLWLLSPLLRLLLLLLLLLLCCLCCTGLLVMLLRLWLPLLLLQEWKGGMHQRDVHHTARHPLKDLRG
jgi:hypothetical protein